MKEEPVQPEVETAMRGIGTVLDAIFNKDKKGEEREWGFALLVFKFGHGTDHRSNYLSNANRDDMLKVMKEFIANVEAED